MKYISEFQNKTLAQRLLRSIAEVARGLAPTTLMEVCGTHTVAIFKHGIKKLLPENVLLISGPGCPVCVTDDSEIDRTIEIAKKKEVILATFGDMLKVPGTSSSLEEARSRGAKVRVVYSPLDTLRIARDNPAKRVVFFGVGFETTSPTIAATLLHAKREKITNFFIIDCFKLIPPAIEALLAEEEIEIDGFILPGHVSTIIGSRPYEVISKKYHLPAVVTGFEPLDVLSSILMLLKQRKENRSSVEIQYRRSVRREGNRVAKKVLNEVFECSDGYWRGLGKIKDSGLKLRGKYRKFSVESIYPYKAVRKKKKSPCRCGEILRGLIAPQKCPLFAKKCTPEHPYGPCMVSSEGTCAAHYKYGG